MYDPNDYRAQRRMQRNQWRAQRQYYRAQRRYQRYQNPMRGAGIALFIIAIIFATSFKNIWGGWDNGPGWLAIFFFGLAFFTLFNTFSRFDRQGVTGGLYSFVWLVGLGICFWIGFWPWILIPVAASMVLSALVKPITAGMANAGFMAVPQDQQTYTPYTQPEQTEQPYTQPEQAEPGYQSYNQGYQGAPQTPRSSYNTAPKDENRQPQAPYPEHNQTLP